MANLVYSYAIDSESSVTAPVRLEDHALIGAAAVAMPGTTLGKGSTLGAMAASLPGAQLPGEEQSAASISSQSQSARKKILQHLLLARLKCHDRPLCAAAAIKVGNMVQQSREHLPVRALLSAGV